MAKKITSSGYIDNGIKYGNRLVARATNVDIDTYTEFFTLIQAAPEMLAKLKEIHEYEHGSDGACECDLYHLIERAEGRDK